MSLYDPDDGAVPRGIGFVALLSQRDLSIQVPINFVTVPGVSLTSACFPRQRYEDTVAAKCFSNLLAIGFRRLEVDLYWDVSRRTWSLCPVQLGSANTLFNTTTIGSQTPLQTSSAMLASGQLTGKDDREFAGPISTDPKFLDVRQTNNVLSSAAANAGGSLVSSTTLPSVATTATLSANSGTTTVATANPSGNSQPLGEGNTLIEAGPFACTPAVDFRLITGILAAYLQNTETDLNATTKYLILNLHAAVPASDLSGSSQAPAADALPGSSNLLSSLVASNNSVYTYTPTDLLSQRSNLNSSGSWFTVTRAHQPEAGYFQVEHESNHVSSPDGWPSESFIELNKAKRLLVGFGNIDEQMLGYNFSGDAGSIFPPGFLSATSDVVTDSAGAVTAGCFFEDGQYSISATNNSWATYDQANTAQDGIIAQALNLTNCGISPLLNETLGGVSAAEDFSLYQTYAYNNNWAWADGEPRNLSSNVTSDNDYQNDRCAALNSTTGRWQSSDCTESHFGACRVDDQPYHWRIGGQKGMYSKVDAGCPDDSDFSVPRTALENTYLVSTWRSYLADHPGQTSPETASDPDNLLWVNFNSLDSNLCWVIGQNTTCPYGPVVEDGPGRTIVIPTIAAVIVFVLALLTVFVKCAANRQSSKGRRRRGDDGWDYEGVPS